MSKQSGYKKVKINLTEHEIAVIAMMAHKRDITFNKMCNIILEEALEEMKNERENTKDIKAHRKPTQRKDNIRVRVRKPSLGV